MSTDNNYLFVTWEGGGNIPPVLGAARRLVDRGARVRVLTEPCLREAVEQIGARYVPFTEHFVRSDRGQDLIGDWKARTPPGALAASLRQVVLGPAAIVARHVSQALDEEPVEAIVVDWLLPAALAVAEARGIPSAVLFHCPNMLPAPGRPAGPMAPATGALGRLRDRVMWSMFRKLTMRHARDFNAMRLALGLAPLAEPLDQFKTADRILLQTTPELDFLGAPDPENLVYVGPVLDEPDWLGDTGWQSPWPTDDRRPLVLASLSSTFQNQHALLQTMITALGMLDVRGLVTLGPAMAGHTFEKPDNVVLVSSAPHGQVFPHVDAFITHCGHGSTVRALSHGVPLVALPMGRDQDGMATRIVHKGLGLAPRRTAPAIARAVQTVLRDPTYRNAARKMAEHIRRDVAADRLTAELLGLASDARMPAAASASRIADVA